MRVGEDIPHCPSDGCLACVGLFLLSGHFLWKEEGGRWGRGEEYESLDQGEEGGWEGGEDCEGELRAHGVAD